MSDQSICMLCAYGDIQGAKKALEDGADINETNLKGETGLILALQRRHNRMVEMLLQHRDVDVNKADNRGKCALHYAVSLQRHQNQVVQLLLQRPEINVNRVDNYWHSVLHQAVTSDDNIETIALLLAREDLTTINQRDQFGWTPLMDAVRCHSVNSFNLLLADHRLDLDMRDDYQRSPEEVHR